MSKYFKCTTNKNPLEYTCGEKIVFSVLARNSCANVGCRFIKWELATDDSKTDSGFGCCSNGVPLIVETVLDRPGFARLTCTALGENYAPDPNFEVLDVSAGADIDKLCYLDTVPDDFDDYWAQLKNVVDNFTPELIQSTEIKDGVPEGIKCYDFRISTPEGRPVSGYMSIPTAEGKYPIITYFTGYTVVGAWPAHYYNAISVCINAHGIENGPCRTELEIKYKDELANYGFSIEENTSNMTTYWRNVMLRDLIGLKFLKTLPQWDAKNITVSGGSQGAFRSTVMASVDPDVTFLDIQVPWFCNMRAEQFGFIKGSRPEFALGLRYFDTVAHATRVKCPVRMKIGLGDYICPPASTMTLYNTFKCEKTLEAVQAMTHSMAIPQEKEHFYKSFSFKNPSGEILNGKYRHFKGSEYEVLGTAKNSETNQQMVIYKALYGEQQVWVRPAFMFNEYVLNKGCYVKRFEYIGK